MEGRPAIGHGFRLMGTANSSKMYEAYYFAHSCGRPYARDEEWLRFFGSIADRIADDIRPRSVLDAGCAWGFLVEMLRQRDVEAYGIDISAYAIQKVVPGIQSYCWVASVADPFPQKYELIVCIEVLEHLEKGESERAVENLCSHSDYVLFSSTPFDYREATHFNVQPPEYWAQLFARQGFFRDIDFDASFITPWAVLYERKNEPVHRLIREYERKYFLLWKENADLRSLAVETQDQLAGLTEKVVEMDKELNTVSNQLQDIYESSSWQWMQRLQNIRLKIIPSGSRRERVFLNLLGKR
jgi:hypothetical protein